MNFLQQDEAKLAERGQSVAEVAATVHRFVHQTKAIKLERPCTASDGISILNASACNKYMELYEAERKNHTIAKLVPASGAASRMFKHLYNYSPGNTSELTEEFILNFDRFPFLEKLKEVMHRNRLELEACVRDNQWQTIFEYILTEKGLHYDAQLKGLVTFHAYPDKGRTAFEEHLHEAVHYAKQHDGTCRIHFTLAPQHVSTVEYFLSECTKEFSYEDFRIECSVQSTATDTPALTKDNELLRDAEGNITFRPSGHGALIRNLQVMDADIIFIKNIDNVTTDSQRSESVFFKKVLAGLLIELRRESHRLMLAMEAGDDGVVEQALEFIQHWFQPGIPIGGDRRQLMQYARLRLDRPLRVCGMVRNEGEPGGGPFWIKSVDGTVSKQIVEKSQTDVHDAQQTKILAESTHFNPVDIVCSIRNGVGKSYELNNFIDHSTGFVSEKFHEGKVIRALELPGLWNGAMALWNTVFVEVPVSTFNPVKTVNDLLRPGHQHNL
ncbi:MAG: DUF4301 family protein [Flavobacteriales bacterium]